jgi:hypothetical protein
MTTMAFDTLQYANRLRAAGVSEEQAEVHAEALAEIIDEKLATKYDLDMAVLKLELKMAELKTETIKWVLGISIAQATIIIACLRLFH